MKSKHATGLLLLSVLLFVNIITTEAMGQNRPPFVSNVHAQQRSGTKLVDITYDVSDPDGGPLTIVVAVSDDGGATFNVPVKTLSGDVGKGILPGTGKKIVWNAGVDYPNVYRTNCRVKITAIDEEGGEGFCPSQDGAPMVLIPAGSFSMGDSFSEGSRDERPVHTVYVDSFCIDVYEVTNTLYANFLNSYGKTVDGAGNELIDIDDSHCMVEKFEGKYKAKPGQENHPAVMISWFGATEYAKFYGKRLPTEAEWEKAARGGLVAARYPWGNSISYDDASYFGIEGADPVSLTFPVGSFPPNKYVLYDIGGNVREWCADWYDSGSDYYSKSPEANPQGPNSGFVRIVRGGGFGDKPMDRMRVADRDYLNPEWFKPDLGFRCVIGVSP